MVPITFLFVRSCNFLQLLSRPQSNDERLIIGIKITQIRQEVILVIDIKKRHDTKCRHQCDQ